MPSNSGTKEKLDMVSHQNEALVITRIKLTSTTYEKKT